ncbi:hypothetical protein F5Y15DRAFT_420480 [Xylariaceae sp. FL0016]|nr:hypothetical protein F5Y15DRAFT_420480 [Xylariaceae sp. FL0016]
MSLEADPTFAEIEQEGGTLARSSEAHTVLDDMFLVSDSIPRQSSYEQGIRGGIRFNDGCWVKDELITDERLVMCHLKGAPLYTVVGGYHLADASSEKLDKSLKDLRALKPEFLMPGHCTGWRFKVAIEKEMPGRMAPIFGGTTYQLD